MSKPIDEYTKEERELIESLLWRLDLMDQYGQMVMSWDALSRVYRRKEIEEARRDGILDIARRYGGMTDSFYIGDQLVTAIAMEAARRVGLYSWHEARDGFKSRQPTDDEFARFCEEFTIRCTAAKVSQQ